MQKKMLLFDLGDTLLRNDKTISKHTLEVLERCREQGYFIGVLTSRGESDSLLCISELWPEVVICLKECADKDGEYMYKAIIFDFDYTLGNSEKRNCIKHQLCIEADGVRREAIA